MEKQDIKNSLEKKDRAISFFKLLPILFMLIGNMLTFSDKANAQPFYPEPNPPVEVREQKDSPLLYQEKTSRASAREWMYHKTADNLHPDGIEQQMMLLMNRARANSNQEGIWLATSSDPRVAIGREYFHVDINVLQNEFAGYPLKPPAAFDVRLYNAAKIHSEDLIARDAQDHNGQFEAIDASGFSFLTARGNIFSYADDGVNAHAAFNIDWGSGTADGMQSGRKHRQAIMSLDNDYTNVGLASVPESNPATRVGPEVVTGNFCYANQNETNHYNRFIIGTVWEDKNKNEMYDPGEGKSDVTVMPDKGEFYAVTSASGGYALPATASGIYQVRFSGNSVPDRTASVSVDIVSVLLDYVVRDNPTADTEHLRLAILYLQILCGITPNPAPLVADVNGDDKIGMAEVIYAMQKAVGLR